MKKLVIISSFCAILCGCGTVGKISHSTVDTTAGILCQGIQFGQGVLNAVIDKTEHTGTNAVNIVSVGANAVVNTVK